MPALTWPYLSVARFRYLTILVGIGPAVRHRLAARYSPGRGPSPDWHRLTSGRAGTRLKLDPNHLE
jgi:hypothetical protein